MSWKRMAGLGAAAVGGVAAHDLVQTRHALKRNFPVVAHARYLLEKVGPELRQYIVTSNDEERPFSRDQRSWVYASAKGQNNYSGFGTDNDVEHLSGYPIIKHRTFADSLPHDHAATTGLPSAKVLGGPRGREKAFRPASLVNISAMSFGSLSAPAIVSLNRGAREAGCLHNTGEGGLSPYHRQGGDLVLQIGTAYFGCRDEHGRFDLEKLAAVVESGPVRAIEIKLSQGAKPGLGGLLPAAKVTEELSQIRGIPMGSDCASPSRHTAFSDVDSLLDFVETVADRTGLPVGIKSAVGHQDFWRELARLMESGERGVDFITVDGGEGGTGASPKIFADSIALPFRTAFARVYAEFAAVGITDRVTFVASGKTGLPENAIVAMALGADMVNVAREAMMAIGCIQAQKCHTDECPTGVATQSPRFTRGLVPDDKAPRAANYVATFRKELVKVTEAVGVAHPGLITTDDIDLMTGSHGSQPLGEVYGYEPGWGGLGQELAAEITALMAPGGSRTESRSIEEGEGQKPQSGFSPH
jgi:glutamate synthase domain-containing protein 2